MKENKHRFIRVFEQAIDEEPECMDPLTHSLPPAHYAVSPTVTQLLEKVRDSLSMITAIGNSSSFFTLVRKMLLIDLTQQQNSLKGDHISLNELYLSPKIQIVPSKPVEWVYGEIKIKRQDNDGSLSPIRINSRQLLQRSISTSALAAIIGSTIIIVQAADAPYLNQIIKMLKEGEDKIGELPKVFPRVIAVTANSNHSDCQLELSALRNRNIEVELISTEAREGWEEQYRLISIGKSIIGSLQPKILGKVAITSKLLNFLWAGLANSGDTFVPMQMWQEAQAALMQEQSEQALQQYMSRIQDITEGQQLLSQSFFRDTQAKVRSDVLRQVAERTGFSPQNENIMKTERRLLEWKQQLQTRNSRAINDWGKSFMRQAWKTIESKLCKEVKSVFALRQQIQILYEFFKKKSEEFLSAELVLNFTEFLLPKILEAAQTITNSIVSPLQEQQMTMQSQILSLATEAKDLRKRANKQESQLARKLQQSKARYMQLQANFEASEKCLEIAKRQLAEIRQNYEQKMLSLSLQHQGLLKQKNQQLQEVLQKMENQSKQIALLSSQLNKQKLLHEQTKHFYEETVELLRSRQAEARTELEEVSLTASRQLCVIRQNSSKELDDFQTNNFQLLEQLSMQQQLLSERNEALEKMKRQLKIMAERLRQVENLEAKVAELELRNKVLQDLESESQAVKLRYRKIQEQQRRLLRQRQQQSFTCQQAVTKALVIEQRYELLSQQIEAKDMKIKQLTAECEHLRAQKQQLQLQTDVVNRISKADASVQAEDLTLKQNLLLALQTINELQEDYSRVRACHDWRRSRG